MINTSSTELLQKMLKSIVNERNKYNEVITIED